MLVFSEATAFSPTTWRREGVRTLCGGEIDLMATRAHTFEFLPYSKVLRMRRIRLQRLVAVELGVEDDVAGVVNSAYVDSDLELEHSRNFSTEVFERRFDKVCGVGFLCRSFTPDVPHHDVLEHDCSSV
jgi:hypothetical protein